MPSVTAVGRSRKNTVGAPQGTVGTPRDTVALVSRTDYFRNKISHRSPFQRYRNHMMEQKERISVMIEDKYALIKETLREEMVSITNRVR